MIETNDNLDDRLDFLPLKNQRELKYLGYTVLNTLPKAKLKYWKRESDKFLKEIKYQFPLGEIYNLINSTYIKTKLSSNKMVDDSICDYIKENYKSSKIEIIPVSHIVKPFGKKGTVWHHDSSVVDERYDLALNVWMPFVNSNRLNGCLWMLPGSHINDNYFREFAYNYIFGDVYEKMKKHMIPLRLKAGSIVLFHRNIIHGSSINWLPIDRVAMEALIINKGAQMRVYRRDPKIIKGKILGYKVDLAHYLSEDTMKNFYSGEYLYDLIDEEPLEVTQKRLIDSIPQFVEYAKRLTK